MKNFIFLIMIGLIFNFEFVFSQKKTELNLDLRNSNIEVCFDEIKKQSDFTFLYRSNLFKNLPKMDIKKSQCTLNELLDELLIPLGFSYEIIDGTVIIKQLNSIGIKTIPKKTEARKLFGKITDKTGAPVPGVFVAFENFDIGTVSNQIGEYIITVPKNKSKLLFKFLGFKTVEVEIKPSQKKLDIEMVTEKKGLDEVVVIGYGMQKKKNVVVASSTLRKSDFNEGSIISPLQLIQGRVAGLQITMNGGEPGAGSTVRIRGASSVRSNQDPLYVVDGVALDITDASPCGANPAGINPSSSRNPLNFLNPADIASIDVLKDASATAIYGARGANGVILITTKKGTKGASRLNYSSYTAISKLPKKLNLLTSEQYRNWFKENNRLIDDKGANTDWQDEIFRTAYTQNHNLSFSGGDENTDYYTSINCLNKNGIIDKTALKKYSGRLQIGQSFFENKLTLNTGLTVARTIEQRVPLAETGGFEGDILLNALNSNPTFPVYNSDSSYYQASPSTRNAVAMINLTDDKTQTDHVLAKIGTNLKIFKNLSYKINYSVDQSNATRKVTQNKELSYLVNNGTVNIANVELTSNLIENYLDFNQKIGQSQTLQLLLGHSFQKFRNLSYNIQVNNFTVEDIDYISNLGYGDFNEANVGSSKTENSIQSFFGRINYNIKDKYMLVTTMRADGSTKFGTNKKYGYFPSFGIAWRLSEESFLKNNVFLTSLKLRLGWGLTGNQEIPGKISQLSLGTVADANYYMDGENSTPGTSFMRTPNPDIQWETTAQTNIGVDFGFFSGRLSGSLDYFNKTTKDVLLEVTSIAPAPTTSSWRNIPEMKIKNSGVELEVVGYLFDNKNFSWASSFNFSKIKNNVIDLPVDVIETGAASGPGSTGVRVQVIKSGYPIGTFWGRRFLGFDENGISRYKTDGNGDLVYENLGTALPDFTFGWHNIFTIGNFDFSFFFNCVYGNKVYNNTFNTSLHIPGLANGSNITRELINTNESINNTPGYSSRYIEDGSFLRLSNCTIGYSLKSESVKYIKNLRFYITATNLFVLTKYSGYDPEVSTDATYQGVPSLGMDYTSYPMSRSIQFGVNIGF